MIPCTTTITTLIFTIVRDLYNGHQQFCNFLYTAIQQQTLIIISTQLLLPPTITATNYYYCYNQFFYLNYYFYSHYKCFHNSNYCDKYCLHHNHLYICNSTILSNTTMPKPPLYAHLRTFMYIYVHSYSTMFIHAYLCIFTYIYVHSCTFRFNT